MKRLLLALMFAALICSGCFADPCNSKTIGNVTLTTCHANGPELHLFISTADPQTTAFYIALRTSTGGMYITADNEIQQTSHVTVKMTGKLAGKLEHVTISELQVTSTSSFSEVNNTLP